MDQREVCRELAPSTRPLWNVLLSKGTSLQFSILKWARPFVSHAQAWLSEPVGHEASALQVGIGGGVLLPCADVGCVAWGLA